ncbi:MAG: hypothetical protein D6719_08700 [Candidatus Dadabacteria bacterium]|nr:MAG: hypothetical protein D6719_08700 [Candidatus Dadabacteria bacterium]
MTGTPGPFQIINNRLLPDGKPAVSSTPITPPRRRYSCENYETCLDLACSLNWDSFTCRGCSGKINKALLWQAHQARKSDLIARKICSIPAIQMLKQKPVEEKGCTAPATLLMVKS